MSELSRLQELFYLEMGASYNLTLEGFIDQVTGHYEKSVKKGIKVFSFDSLGMENSLSLTVGSHKMPYIAAVTIRQATTNLDRILENVNGDFEVNYSRLEARTMHRYRREMKLHSADGNLYKISMRKDSRFNNLLGRLTSMGNEVKEIIGRGESFIVKDSSYEDNDPRNVLMHMHCSIRHDGAHYLFDYALGTANLDSIPKDYLKDAESIFAVAAPFFRKASFHRARISSFRGD